MTKWTVYLLCNENLDLGRDVYVGSTSLTLAKRLSNHKNDCSRIGNEENKLYVRMREVGLENWIMRPLLTLESTGDEIRAFERMWCEILRSDLNTISPIRSAAERYQNNKEVILRKKAEHYRKNKEVILRKNAERYQQNKEVLRQRYQENREFFKQKSAEYREKNKDSKKYFCDVCETSFQSSRDLKRHENSLKHQFAFLNSLD